MAGELTERILTAGATVGDLSGGALAAAVDRMTDQVAAAGIGPGEAVGLRGANRAEWVVALVTLLRSGARPVLLSHDSPDPEVMRTVAAAGGSRCLLVDTGDPGWLGPPVATAAAARPASAPCPETVLLATSGSTGAPKLIARDGGSLLAEGIRYVTAGLARATDTVLVPLPMTHAYALGWVVGTLLAGARLVPVPPQALDAIRQALADGATVLPVVPGWARLVLRRLDHTAKLPELRLVMAGAGHVDADLDNRWATRTGVGLARNYGSTETGAVAWGPAGLPSGCVGRPMPGLAIRLRSDDGSDLDGAGFGEVAVTLEDGTEHRMGDLAHRDESGWLRIIGRRSTNAIRRGARWVSTAEVRSVLATARGVADVLVTGSSAEHDDATLVAEFVPAGAAVTADDLAAYARANLAPYKVPNVFRARRRIERGPLGKAPRPLSYQLVSEPVLADALRAYRRSEVLLSLAELDALPALAEGRTAAQLAAELQLDVDVVTELLVAGHELGLVAPAGAAGPVEAPRLADRVRAEQELRPLIDGATLASAARGRPAPVRVPVRPRSPERVAALHRIAQLRATETAGQFGTAPPGYAAFAPPAAPAGSYDVCFVVDTVHGPAPHDDLAWLAERLRPGGRLVVEDRFLDGPEPTDRTVFLAWLGAGARSWFRVADLQAGLESLGLRVGEPLALDDPVRTVVVAHRDRAGS